MLWEFVLAGLIVAGLLLVLGWYALINNADNKGNLFLVAGALMLLVTGLFSAVDSQGIEIQSDCVNATNEISHVWNCSNETYDCFGTPEPKSCWWYNLTQCEDIDGCEWVGNNCYGTPEWTCEELYDYGGEEKCGETKGCYMWNETLPHSCDSYYTEYTYGPCYKETIGFNFTQMLGAMLMLAGIGTLLGVIGWSKYGNIYKNV